MQICWKVMIGDVLQVLATVHVSQCQLSERFVASLPGPSHSKGTVYNEANVIILFCCQCSYRDQLINVKVV